MLLFFVFLYGLVIGSFLNVCISRLPAGESLVTPPSHCTACNTQLKARDLIPVLSWVFLRGKCRYCGEKISWSYTVTELVNAIVWVLIIWHWGLTPLGIAGVLLFSLSLVITQIDLAHYLIPNSLVIILLAAGIAYHFFAQDLTLVNRLIGLGVGFAVPFLLALLSRGGMGGGDIKLMGAIGFWLGFPGVLYALFVGALLGSIVGVGLIIWGKKKRKDPIPFGPFLVLGFLFIFLWADQVASWSWNLF